MKRKVIALLLCALMIFSSVPAAPLSQLFTFTAQAAELNTVELEQVFAAVPDKSQWGKYVDTSLLEMWYDTATDMLANPEAYTQTQVDNCAVKLKAAFDALEYHTTGITLNKKTASAYIGQVVTLSASLTPSNAADSVVWTSADTNLATVTQNGQVTVTGYSPNGVKITATSNGYSASCQITTLNQLGGVNISNTTATIYEGGSMTLSATAYGKDTSSKPTDEVSYTWSSSNTSVVTVSDTGYIKGINNGTATVTVIAMAGTERYTASCTVTVNDLVPITALQPITVATTSGLVMTEGESISFKVLILPSNASVKTLKWKSGDTSIANVSDIKVNSSTASATITALKEGKTKVAYAAADGSGISGYFIVDVRPGVSSLTATESVKVIAPDAVGEKITVKILPVNAGNQTLTWTSSNNDICQVDYAGVLYPKAYGLCTITGTTTDGSNLKVSVTVRVADKSASVALDRSSLSLVNGKSYTLFATVKTLSGLSYGEVKWTTNNSTVASVSQKGVVTAKYPGTAVITATTLDGTNRSAVCVVTVTQPLTSISITEGRAVPLGKTAQIYVSYTPTYASNKNVTWTSSDTSVVTVSSSGQLYGKKAGTATVYCVSKDGGFTDSCFVRVYIPATGITMSKTSASIWCGASYTLKATLAPTNATYKTIKWTSSNTKVATVDQNGVVTAKAGGTAVITAASAEGGYKATCTITVKEKVTGVSLSRTAASLYTTQSYTLTATVVPATASVKTVKWSSSNSSVATVSSTGVVTAKAVGTTTITATSTDGGYTASCVVKVYKKVNVTGITIDTAAKTVYKGKTYTIVATIWPSNASDKGVYWKSSNTAVATVSSAGIVKGVASGTAVITATTRDGSYTKQCKITVTQPVTTVKLNSSSVTLAVGASKTLTATVYPSDATNKTVKWTTSDSSVVTVTQNGVVTAKGSGSAVIKATTNDGNYVATCNFTVYVPVTGIKLSATSLLMAKSTTRLLRAVVTPENATTTDVTWTSSDTSVATVNASGLVTAKQTGAAKITATSSDGKMYASCVVTVYQQVTDVNLSVSSVTLAVGKSKTISVTVKPSTATYKSVTWTSSDSTVAKVSSVGVVTALKAGTVTITATSKDKCASASCKVTVTQPATGIVLNYAKAVVRVGGYRVLKATVLPVTATNTSVTWKSSDEGIATVDQNGVVTGVSKGSVYIIATNSEGKSAKCLIGVYKSVTGITLNKTSLTLNVGKTSTITPVIQPSDAGYKTVIWTSSNNDVATVNSNGVVKAIAPGYAKITATTTDGKKTASCDVLAVQPVTGVKLNKSTASVYTGNTLTLKASILPTNASNPAVTWSSSNTSIAKVSSNGVVTAIKPGSVTITVKTADGGYSAKCVITVVRKVTGLTLDKSSATLYIGKTLKLVPTISPSDATNKSLYWYSGNTAIAKVNQNGVVTPVKTGKVTIGVMSLDGKFKAYCSVTVKKAVESIKLDKTSVTLKTGGYYRFTATVLPSDATDKTVKYISSDTSILAINQAGLIKGIKRGVATVSAVSSNGLVAKCTVTVTQDVKGVNINKTTLTLYTGETEQLKYVTVPADANNQNVTWSSSNASVAGVTSTGVVKALKAGTAVIKVKTAQGGYIDECTVTVKQKATSVLLDKTTLSLNVGEYHRFTANVLPSDATDKTVKWYSSDTSVLAINQAGLVKGVKRGTATVTVKSADGVTTTCSVTVVQGVNDIEIGASELTLYTKEKYTMPFNVLPSDANNKEVIWSTSNSAVASVSSDGVITALKAGEAVISVITVDGGFEKSCAVTVKQHVTSVSFKSDSMTLKTDEETDLIYTVLPADATNKAVSFTVSDNTVLSVSKTGHVKALKAGVATVTVTTADMKKTAECVITVIRPVTGVTLNKNEITLYKGTTEKLIATIAPEDASDKKIIWTSSDNTVATIADGLITAKEKGTATITAKTNYGDFVAKCVVDVIVAVAAIETDSSSYTLKENTTTKMTAVVLPENAHNQNITFKSTDESIATVNDEGVITGVKKGVTTITVRSEENPNIKATVTVEVIKPVTSISLNKDNHTLNTGDTVALIATVLPEDANDTSFKWVTSDKNVATVSSSGVVTALKAGTATISAITNDGEFKAQCVITVYQIAQQVSFPQENYSVITGEDIIVEATVLPEDTSFKQLTWTSSNESIATVDQRGIVTGVKAGTVEITAKVNYGGVSKTVTVEVIQQAQEIKLTAEKDVLWVGGSVTIISQVLPEDTTDKTLTWVSSDNSVIKVENGVVTAVGAGTATVTAISSCKKASAVLQFEVRQQVTGVQINASSTRMYVAETANLTCVITPENSFNKAVTWISDDSSIVSVDDNGVITAHKAGTTQITCQTSNSEVNKTISITVVQQAYEVNITAQKNILWLGDTITINSQVLPENTTDKTLTWKSSNEDVITVTDGKVTTVGVGEAVVSAVSACGKASDEIKFEVRKQVESLQISASATSMFVGETVEITGVVTPDDAYDKSLTWHSSDESIATVSDEGVVSGLKGGTVEITCKTTNSEVFETVKIDVIQQAKQVVLTLDKSVLWIGETLTIKSEVLPTDTTDKTLTWLSSDDKVVKVENGEITAIGVGEAYITAISACKKALDKVKIEVRQPITGIEISPSATSVNVGETITISHSVTPENAYDKTVTYLSSDETIASVSSSGVVTGNKAGTVQITCKSNSSEVSKTVSIEVIQLAEKINITAQKNVLWIGETLNLKSEVLPSDTTDKTLIWTTSDDEVATIDNGVVTAMGTGTATIVASAKSGTAMSFIRIEVRQQVTSLEITGEKSEVNVGDKISLSCNVGPENAYDKSVTWCSSDEKIATVDEGGNVTGVAGGEVVITATSNTNSSVKATFKVTVIQAVEGVQFLSKEYVAYIGRPLQIQWSVEPANATNKDVTFNVGDSAVATVDENGNVTALSVGRTTVTVVTKDGQFVDYCIINVKKGIDLVQLDKSEFTMQTNSTLTLNVTAFPEDATDKQFIWTSSDESVVKVENGILTSFDKQQAVIITVMAADNKEAVARCIVLVED